MVFIMKKQAKELFDILVKRAKDMNWDSCSDEEFREFQDAFDKLQMMDYDLAVELNVKHVPDNLNLFL